MAEEEKKSSSAVPALRTLKTDAVSFSSDKKISFIQAAASELARRQERGGAVERGETMKKILVIFLAGLAFVGLLGGGAYYFFTGTRAPKAEVLPRAALLKGDLEKTALLGEPKKEKLREEIQKGFFEPLAEGEIRTLAFAVTEGEAKRTLQSGEIIALAELPLPPRLRGLVEALELGSVRQNGIHPFIIFKVRSYPEALAAMLSWEQSLAADVGIFFPNTRDFDLVGIAYQDRVIKNQDARVLLKDGEAVLAYAFFNRSLLVIAASDSSLDAVLARLQAL